MTEIQRIERVQLVEEIFNYFNSNPTSTFVEISNNITRECTPNKVRRLLLEMGGRKLNNGLTIREQLDLKKKDQKDFLNYVFKNPNCGLMDIVNNTGISIDKVNYYYLKFKDYVLSNGNTLDEQRNINRENTNNIILNKKLCVLNYFLKNPDCTYSDIGREFSISYVTVKEYLDCFSDVEVPSTGLTVSEQLNYNKNKYNELKVKIIDYFNYNPRTSFIELSRIFNCSKSFVWSLFQDNLDYELTNGLTIKEQLRINNPLNDEKLIVDYFKIHYEISLRRLAYEIDSDLDSIRNYLYKHVGERLNNGLTIGEQLNKNNHEIWHRSDDIIPDSGVFIRNRDGSYRGLITEIDGLELNLRDSYGNKIGTIVVSNDFEDMLVIEGIIFLLKEDNIIEYINNKNIDYNTLFNYLNKIRSINKELFIILSEKINLSTKNSISDIVCYSDDKIDEIIICMINYNMSYNDASSYFNIDLNVLKELVKRGNKDLVNMLNDNFNNKKKR